MKFVIISKVKEPKKNEQKPEQKKEVKVSYAPVKQRGLRVVARNDDDGFYYPGLPFILNLRS